MKALLHWSTVLAAALPVFAAEPPLRVEDATQLALQHSRGAQLAAVKTSLAEADARAARLQRYPRITAFGLGGYYFRPLDLKVRQGALTPALDSLGVDLGLGPLSPTIGPFPSTDLSLVRGRSTQAFGGLTILQPLTQQWRIASGVRAAEAARTAAGHETARLLAEIRVGVEELFAGILIEDRRIAQHAARVAFRERQLQDAENAHAAGEALDDAVLGGRAALVQARTDLLRSRQQRAKLSLQLADLIGRPGQDDFTLAPNLPERAPHPLDHWLMKAEQNPDWRIAAATAEQARAGVRAARQARIPDVSAFAAGFTQDGLPLVPSTGGSVGVALTWDVFDFGRRDTEIARSLSRQRAAELSRDRAADDAARLIRVAYQDFNYANELIALAGQAEAYRRRAAELARQSATHGLALETAALAAEAEWRAAEADLAGARLQRHLALLRLYFLVGELD